MLGQAYKDLIVWQKSIILVKEIYKITRILPPIEDRGLKSQMQRSAISIPSNIAEGRKRGTRKDFTNFLRIANGSLAELETQLIIAKELYSLKETSTAEGLLEEVAKMLSVMIGRMSA